MRVVYCTHIGTLGTLWEEVIPKVLLRGLGVIHLSTRKEWFDF